MRNHVVTASINTQTFLTKQEHCRMNYLLNFNKTDTPTTLQVESLHETRSKTTTDSNRSRFSNTIHFINKPTSKLKDTRVPKGYCERVIVDI